MFWTLGFEQCCLEVRSIFPKFFQISPCGFDFCHFVMIFSKRKSGSFCSVTLHKQPKSAVLLQKSKQSWQKAKQVGDIWKNSGKMLQAIEEAWYKIMCTKIWRLYVFTFYVLCRERIFSTTGSKFLKEALVYIIPDIFWTRSDPLISYNLIIKSSNSSFAATFP